MYWSENHTCLPTLHILFIYGLVVIWTVCIWLILTQCCDHLWQNRICINSLAAGWFEWHFRHVIFKLMWVIDGWGIPCEIVPIWMSLDFTDDQSTLVQVMAWCRQATNHYLRQCWPRSLTPYGVTGPQCININRAHEVSYYLNDEDIQQILCHILNIFADENTLEGIVYTVTTIF